MRRSNLTTCPLKESNTLCQCFLNLNSSSGLSCKWKKSYGVKGLIFLVYSKVNKCLEMKLGGYDSLGVVGFSLSECA